MLGALIGSIAGGLGAWYFSDDISDFKIKGLPTGGKKISISVSQNLNFAFVLLGRAVLHHQLISTRTHANRDKLILADMNPTKSLPKSLQLEFLRLFRSISKGNVTLKESEKCYQLILRVLTETETEELRFDQFRKAEK